MSERNTDPYLDTIGRMEPGIAMVDVGAAAASISISLKRIADALDRLTTPETLLSSPEIHGAVTNLLWEAGRAFAAGQRTDR